MSAAAGDELVPRVRLFIFEHFLEHATPPVAEQLMQRFPPARTGSGRSMIELGRAQR